MVSPTSSICNQGIPSRAIYANWDGREVLIHGISLTIALVAAAVPAHLSGRPLLLFALFGFLLVGATLFARQYRRIPNSPLGIDVTARTLRSILVGLAIVVASAALIPEIRLASWRSFLTYACFITVSRIDIFRPQHAGIPELSRFPSGQAAWYRTLKRVLDLIATSLLVAVLAPLFLVIAVAIKADSDGPILFLQERIGFRGRRFRILKFRTMRTSAPGYARSPVDTHDLRITRVGRLLRRFSLDELPQLLNVLRGEMSLVGPRPEMPFIVRQYASHQRERLNAIPGLTGLWQISPARALPIHENLDYDLYYIAHCSLFLDLAVLCRTVGAVIRGIGAV